MDGRERKRMFIKDGCEGDSGEVEGKRQAEEQERRGGMEVQGMIHEERGGSDARERYTWEAEERGL